MGIGSDYGNGLQAPGWEDMIIPAGYAIPYASLHGILQCSKIPLAGVLFCWVVRCCVMFRCAVSDAKNKMCQQESERGNIRGLVETITTLFSYNFISTLPSVNGYFARDCS
jgi:hypothetical protein